MCMRCIKYISKIQTLASNNPEATKKKGKHMKSHTTEGRNHIKLRNLAADPTR